MRRDKGGGAEIPTKGGVAGMMPGGCVVELSSGRVLAAARMLPGVPLAVGGPYPYVSGFNLLEGDIIIGRIELLSFLTCGGTYNGVPEASGATP